MDNSESVTVERTVYLRTYFFESSYSKTGWTLTYDISISKYDPEDEYSSIPEGWILLEEQEMKMRTTVPDPKSLVLKGLEATLKDLTDKYVTEKLKIEDKIQQLLALPAPDAE